MNELLLGRTVLVAGGTGNVGRVLVRSLLAAGATVAVPSRSAERLRAFRCEVAPDGADRLLILQGNIADDEDADRLVGEIERRAGPLHAGVATLGRFVPVPSVLNAAGGTVREVIDSYLLAHLGAAQAVIPRLRERGGSYTFINGFLAFQPTIPGAGLVSTVTAAQAMLARVVMGETADTAVRVNEVVLYTMFGGSREDEAAAPVSQEDVGAYVAWLLSTRAATVRGQSIHLSSSDAVRQALASLD